MRISLGLALVGTPVITSVAGLVANLLKQDGGFVLLESGAFLLLE